MTKLTYTLDKVKTLKDGLENAIIDSNIKIQKFNTIKEEDRPYNLLKIEKYKEDVSKLLLKIHVQQQIENTKSLFGDYSNNYYIRLLSQMNMERSHLNKIQTTDNSFISTSSITDRIKHLISEKTKIVKKMDDFNKSHKITIEVDDTELNIINQLL